MTRLSVNINKIATLRNARGGNNPDVIKVAQDCECFGAQGITVHPRPDERHIRRSDVDALCQIVTTEFNIEGYPSADFLSLVEKAHPAQVTFVPDAPDQLTSNHGWDAIAHKDFLTTLCTRMRNNNIRTSIFIDADVRQVEAAKACGCDRVELYTEPYAANYATNREAAIAPFVKAAERCREVGLGLNAGHDLSLQNLAYLHQQIPWIDEVSIGHALICEALYLGLEETIHRYLQQLKS